MGVIGFLWFGVEYHGYIIVYSINKKLDGFYLQKIL